VQCRTDGFRKFRAVPWQIALRIQAGFDAVVAGVSLPEEKFQISPAADPDPDKIFVTAGSGNALVTARL
jgi:hypothetical protein